MNEHADAKPSALMHTMGAREPLESTSYSASPNPPRPSNHTEDQNSLSEKNDIATTSLLSPEPKAPRRLTTWRHMLSNTWLLEVLAISFSVMSLVAIAAVLLVYDGQRDPQLRYGITLNAVISLLATASKSSLLCSVAGMMAQLKWEWFNKERKLFDIQSFDQASRGPAGSIALLCGRASRSLASLGAFIVILALLFDAFIQQLITYPLRDTVEYNTTAIHRKASIFVIDPNSTPFISAMNRGAWSEATQYNRSSTCPSGHCTWPVYESIGWCSRCVNALPYAKLHGSCDWRSIRNGSTYVGNATHHLQDMCKLTLGPGKDVTIMQAAQDKVVTVRKAAWTVDALEFALYKNPSEAVAQVDNVALGIRGPALTLGYATVDYGVYQGPRVRPSQSLLSNFTKATVTSAEECVLTPCLRKYNTTVEAGIESANVLSINYGRTQYQNTTSILAGIRRYVQPITCWQPNSDKVTYVLVGEAFVKGPDSGQYFPFLANVTQKAFCPVPVYGYTVGDFLTRNALASQLLTFPKGHAQGYWHSMDHSDVMCGNVITTQAFVSVQWGWFVLPIVLELAGIVLVISTVIPTHSRKSRLWKSSLLPLLYHGLDERLLHEQPVENDLAWMEKTAEEARVRLAASGDGDRILFVPP